ncbi:MAG: hypothetical protein PF694_05985 [Bacteroidetes bacterium]|jgi:predicted RNA-binding protein with EMAP domain|nr:hypothetical protein [Bacteroidota bacterium]
MNKANSGDAMNQTTNKISMEVIEFGNDKYFKIPNHNQLRPFFMSIVSDANHWMFVASNGGISAGRKNPEYALFPYYTDDKIIESADLTGSKSIFSIKADDKQLIWEPFSNRYTNQYAISRNLYKSVYGNKIIFEEVNHSLKLTFHYQWNNSKKFGFIRNASLINNGDKPVEIEILDGIQNIMPYGVPSDLQRSTSNLVDAYKRNEIDQQAGIGIFALSAIIVDRAEPSEALKANIAWSLGLKEPRFLLSSLQLEAFRNLQPLRPETDIKGEKGAYFVHVDLKLDAGDTKGWKIIANVNQTQTDIIRLREEILNNEQLEKELLDDIADGTEQLIKLVAAADGLQRTADQLNDTRYFSNVLFNIMRGGIFDKNYQIDKKDFKAYLAQANHAVAKRNETLINQLTDNFALSKLKEVLINNDDVDLVRLAIEYLPLRFSRRHGDPSRPWNYFSINTQSEIDGSKILDYEGNWRDLFQNWEALAHAYPEFIKGMIFKFLNASTFDGYNPYRVTKDGFDWETIEPDNPWSYIGYWGDHQIIYLQKFLEIAESYYPGSLNELFEQECFVYAAVPYIIKPYEEILKNPKDTITFSEEWDTQIRKMRENMGADGTLLSIGDKDIYHVNFIEKILVTVLAKLSNFVPEAGIWMNTQRPEWNDANNALVGNGVSMVTLYYLYRFLKFFDQLLEKTNEEQFKVSAELTEFYHSLRDNMLDNKHLLKGKINDADRKRMLDSFGEAASAYRHQIYENGFWGKKRSISRDGLKSFTSISLAFIAHSIQANQRPDKLYHAYNLLTINENKAEIHRLSEMLEGQVAVLSSGYLNSKEALEVLNALKASSLFRPDQYSYILYPNKELPGFLQKNNIPKEAVASSKLLKQLLSDGNRTLIEEDVAGGYHFNGNFRNAGDLKTAIDRLPGKYATLIEQEEKRLLDIFEQVFNHKSFTGRSGTFYAFEGLGSIYWHMVSKLQLAVLECCLKAVNEQTDEVVAGELLAHYYEIDAGIGVHKSPELYGAFPTDPYSHTPSHRGAQQPGMTGQVKEDILVHHGEMGLFARDGLLFFNPRMLRKQAFLNETKMFSYHDVDGNTKQITLKAGQLAFTYCQTPVVYILSDRSDMTVYFMDGSHKSFDHLQTDSVVSEAAFGRKGIVDRIEVNINTKLLK